MSMRFVALDQTLSWADERRLYRLSARLSRYFGEIVMIEWHLSREGRRHVAACNVHARSGYYRAQVLSERLSTAVGRALDKLVRQRRRQKIMGQTARRGRRRTPGSVTASALP